MARHLETSRDRLAIAEDAGIGRISPVSVLAGTMAAYGAFVLILAIVGAVAASLDVDANFADNDWRRLGVGAGTVTAVALFLAYFLGGYTAGRMARRAGVLHGVLVFLAGIAIAVGAALLVDGLTDSADTVVELRALGVPTSTEEWEEIGTFTGIASLVLMAVGAIAGGSLGERWHGRLITRAFDPGVGREAELERRAAGDLAAAEQRRAARAARVARLARTRGLPDTAADSAAVVGVDPDAVEVEVDTVEAQAIAWTADLPDRRQDDLGPMARSGGITEGDPIRAGDRVTGS